jgi:hypothetical protein
MDFVSIDVNGLTIIAVAVPGCMLFAVRAVRGGARKRARKK